MPQTLGEVARIIAKMWTPQLIPQVNTVAPGQSGFTLTDLTGTMAVAAGGQGDFGSPMNHWHAIVNLKTFVQGTTPSGFGIDLADDATMSSNFRNVAVVTLPIAAGPWCFRMRGRCPDGAKRYGRIGVVFGAGASGTYDAYLCAAP